MRESQFFEVYQLEILSIRLNLFEVIDKGENMIVLAVKSLKIDGVTPTE